MLLALSILYCEMAERELLHISCKFTIMNSEAMIFDIVDRNCVVYNISLTLNLVILYLVFGRNDLESQGLG